MKHLINPAKVQDEILKERSLNISQLNFDNPTQEETAYHQNLASIISRQVQTLESEARRLLDLIDRSEYAKGPGERINFLKKAKFVFPDGVKGDELTRAYSEAIAELRDQYSKILKKYGFR